MKRDYWAFALLLVAVALVYSNALSGPFVFDDKVSIQYNPDIRQLWPPAWAMPNAWQHSAVNSRPLTSLSLALNYAFNGLQVEGYRLVNIALHALCGLALYAVVRRLLERVGSLAARAPGLALVSALLWSVHPLNNQVVNYTIQRSVSLMALCYLGMLYCFLRSIAPGGGRWQVAAVVCCLLGMMAKEVMVSAPLAVLLCDGIFVASSYREALVRRAKLYGGLVITWLVLLRGLWTAPHGETIGFGRGVDAWTYLLNQSHMIAVYLRLSVWPHPLSLDYGYPRDLAVVDVWPEALLVLGLVAAIAIAVYRRWHWGMLGAFAFLLLAPTSSFVPIVNEVGAERRMYLPLAAVVIGIVVAVDALCRRWRYGRRAGLVLSVVAAAALAWGGSVRNGDYASEVAIWQSAVTVVPDNHRAHYNLGISLVAIGETDAAQYHYRRALALAPEDKDANNNLGLLLAAEGKDSLAAEHFRRAIAADTAFVKARVNLANVLVALDRHEEAMLQYRRAVESNHTSTWARYHLGVALEEEGQQGEAMLQYRWALGIDPKMIKAHYRLGLIYAQQARLPNAVFHLREVVSLNEDYAAAHFHLGRALSRQDSTAKGLQHYRQAVALDSNMVEAQYNLGTALMKKGDAVSALPHLRKVVDLSPELAEARNNLGIALQATGRLHAAIDQFGQALRLRPGYVAAQANLQTALAQAGKAP